MAAQAFVEAYNALEKARDDLMTFKLRLQNIPVSSFFSMEPDMSSEPNGLSLQEWRARARRRLPHETIHITTGGVGPEPIPNEGSAGKWLAGLGLGAAATATGLYLGSGKRATSAYDIPLTATEANGRDPGGGRSPVSVENALSDDVQKLQNDLDVAQAKTRELEQKLYEQQVALDTANVKTRDLEQKLQEKQVVLAIANEEAINFQKEVQNFFEEVGLEP